MTRLTSCDKSLWPTGLIVVAVNSYLLVARGCSSNQEPVDTVARIVLEAFPGLLDCHRAGVYLQSISEIRDAVVARDNQQVYDSLPPSLLFRCG